MGPTALEPRWAHIGLGSAAQDDVAVLTDWMPAVGILEATTWMSIRTGTAGFGGQVVYQVAPVRPSKPATTWTALSTGTSGGSEDQTQTNDVSVDDSLWIRFGVRGKLSSPSDIGEGDVGLQVMYDATGEIVAAAALDLEYSERGTGSPSVEYVAVTPMLPLVAGTNMKAALIVSGLVQISGSGSTNTLQLKLAWRTSAGTPEEAGDWQVFSSPAYTAEGEYNTGKLTATGASGMWIQFGLQLEKVVLPGSSLIPGTVAAQVAIVVAQWT